MGEPIWLSFSASERTLLMDALVVYERAGQRAKSKLVQKLALANQKPHPEITVGVYGGVVQWVIGNPFPVRIVDYDGDPKELPDVDDHGHRCTIGFEQPQPAPI